MQTCTIAKKAGFNGFTHIPSPSDRYRAKPVKTAYVPSRRRITGLKAGVNKSAAERGIAPLLLADVVIERIGAKDSALRAANDPFLTIGVITRLADGIIGYYVHYQILISVIN